MNIRLYYILLVYNRKLYKARKPYHPVSMKKIMSATIDTELVKWLEQLSKNTAKYRNRSHIVEIALHLLKEQEEKEKKK